MIYCDKIVGTRSKSPDIDMWASYKTVSGRYTLVVLEVII